MATGRFSKFLSLHSDVYIVAMGNDVNSVICCIYTDYTIQEYMINRLVKWRVSPTGENNYSEPHNGYGKRTMVSRIFNGMSEIILV